MFHSCINKILLLKSGAAGSPLLLSRIRSHILFFQQVPQEQRHQFQSSLLNLQGKLVLYLPGRRPGCVQALKVLISARYPLQSIAGCKWDSATGKAELMKHRRSALLCFCATSFSRRKPTDRRGSGV